MEQIIVMIIFGIFFGIWKVIENASVPGGKLPPGNNRPPLRETSRQKLQNELDKFLREVNKEEPVNQPFVEQKKPPVKTAVNPSVFQAEKPKPRQETAKESRKQKQKTKLEAKPAPVPYDHSKPHESKIKNRLPPSKLSTVESHVQSYMGHKLESNVAESTTAHLKPFATHITGEASKAVASNFNDVSANSINKAVTIIHPSQLFQLMHDQNSVRNAVILSEILKRPDFSRFRKPTHTPTQP